MRIPETFELGIDENGREYVAYNSVVGPVRDYSPWTVKEAKARMNKENDDGCRN